jgi:HlyD family secretion protein
LVSDEIQELVSYRPHWIIRKGNMFFLSIIILCLGVTWFVKYPDIIKGSMLLTAINAPKLLIAKSEGKLEKLLVSNEQIVVMNQPLAFLQSTGNHNQALDLRNWIALVEPAIVKDSIEILLELPLPILDQLGEIQSDYQNFQSVLNETLEILNNGYYQKKKLALLKDLDYLSSIKSNAEEQRQLLKQDYDLQLKEYKANELLERDRIIAPIELNQNKSKVIGKEQALRQINAQFINNSMTEHNKRKEILDLSKFIRDQQQKFKSELFTLKSRVETWIQQYVVIAPETGMVLFSSFLQENQFLSLGQELFYIQPDQASYYGKLMVSQTGLGKIKEGEKVLVRLHSYPSDEFGYMTGVVKYISYIPTAKDSFLIKVDLPKGLRTSYNKTILFRNNLKADAEIITDNRKLFDRIIGHTKDQIER